MNLISNSIRRPVAVTMCYLVIFFMGVAALYRLPVELVPEVDYPKLTVNTSWYDSSPEAVEAHITAPIEAVANTVRHVHKVESTSSEGSSVVDIEFLRGTDMDFAALELNEKLSKVYDELPFGVTHPRIQKFVPREFQTGQFLTYHVAGPFTPDYLRELLQKKLKNPLMGVKGVAGVEIRGGEEPEIRIEINPQKQQAFGISQEQLVQALQTLHLRVDAGKIYQQGKKWSLLVEMPLDSIETIEQSIIANQQGRLIRLSDIGRLVKTYQPPRRFTRINGQSAVLLILEREVGTNTIEVADRVFARLEQLKSNLPVSIKLFKQLDQSEKIRTEFADLSQRSLFSILVIFLVLVAFLKSFKTPVIILLSIFFSVLLTVNLFYFAKMGFNLITLAGLALGFGMLVDNSIVVVDNIFRYHHAGEKAIEAAEKGTKGVALAIIASTLTTIVVFLPFLYMTGELRIYYLPFASAVGLSLAASLVVAFTLTPALTARLLPEHHVKEEPHFSKTKPNFGLWRGLKAVFNPEHYRNYLQWAFKYRWVVIFGTIFLFAGSYYLFDKYVTKGTIWNWESGTYLMVNISMPVGSELEMTDSIARKFEEKLVGHPELERIHLDVYKEFARMHITFPPELELTAVPLIWKDFLIGMATQYAGVSVSVAGYGPGFYSGGGGAAPSYHLTMLGYNYNEVKRFAEETGRKLARNARVRDVNTNSQGWFMRDDQFEMVLRPDRNQLDRYQMTHQELFNQLQTYLRENLQLRKIQLRNQEIALSVKVENTQNFDDKALEQLLITTPAGEKLRLSEVAEISQRQVMGQIVREDQQYQRGIAFEFRGPPKMGDKYVDAILKNTHLPPGYKLERRSFLFMREEEKQQIYIVLAVSLLLVFMVTAALFESLKQPLIVILTVPMALIGVFVLFYWTDAGFDRNAYIGVILLSGIVVNNSIILIDHINALRRADYSRTEAIIQGAQDRVRPILMTSGTTIVGLLPLILFASDKTSIWYSLALATIGGLLSSVFLVLTVIPVIYYLFTK